MRLRGSAPVRKFAVARGSVEVYPARKGASPGSAKLSDVHEEGSQVCERASERYAVRGRRDTDSWQLSQSPVPMIERYDYPRPHVR